MAGLIGITAGCIMAVLIMRAHTLTLGQTFAIQVACIGTGWCLSMAVALALIERGWWSR